MPSKIKNPYLKETPGLKKFVENSKPLVTRGYGGQENVHRGEGQRIHKPGTAGTGARTTMTSGVGYEANTDMRSESRGSRAFREWEAKYNATGKALQPKSTASKRKSFGTPNWRDSRKTYVKLWKGEVSEYKIGGFQSEARQRQANKKKVGQFQTKGKKSLLTSQPTKSKGGGKSGGGGGGKWGWFNRMRHSPWNLLRNDKSF